MRQYLTISTLIGIFLEGLYLTLNPFSSFTFDLKPGIIIVLFNLFILTIVNKIYIKPFIFLIIGYLAISSYIVFSGFESFYLKQLIQISALMIYFYSFIRFVGVEYVFKTYVKCAYLYSIFALLYFGAEVWFELPYLKFMPEVFGRLANGGLHGLMAEQSVYSMLMIPALYYSLYERAKFGLKVPIIIGFSIFVTYSAMGFIGILLTIVLYKELSNKLLISLVLLFILSFGGFLFYEPQVKIKSVYDKETIYYCYENCSENRYQKLIHHPYVHFAFANPSKRELWSEKNSKNNEVDRIFKDRILLSIKSALSGKVPEVHVNNVSSYTLISNLLVMKNVIKNNPFFGGGLGSHPLNYDKYISQVDGAASWLRANVDLGRLDGNSLLIRILSELGLFGFLLVFLFLLKTYKGVNDSNYRIAYSIYIYLILVFIRSGTYGSLDLFLFIFSLYFITLKKKEN